MTASRATGSPVTVLPRREFLRLLGIAAGAAGIGGCGRPWAVPDRLVELAARGPGLESTANIVCGLCDSGCGLTVRLIDGLPVGLRGNPQHPLNRGGVCPVGHAGLDLLYSPDRLQRPLGRGTDGSLTEVDWDQALGDIANRLTALRADGGGHRVALLSGEPGDLFHDLAGRFLAVLGSGNLARTPGSSALPYRLMQGLETEPGFDLTGSDLVLSFGLDVFGDGPTPLHAIAAMVGERATDGRAAVLDVGTRLSLTAGRAEERVEVRPGTHGAFALGVAHVLVREGRYDHGFIADRTSGFHDWSDANGQRLGFRRMVLERYYPERVAQMCGCDPGDPARMARRFAVAERPLAVAGGDAASGSNATWTVMAVHALNALAGSLNRPGGVLAPAEIPFSPLPDPGGLPAPSASVFTGGEGLFGGDPVEALAAGIEADEDAVDVLFVVSADPLLQCAAGRRLRDVLDRIPLVVALAPFHNATSAAAHYVLPTPVPLESWQAVTTPPTVAFATLGLSAPVIEPLHGSRHPADVLLDLARRAAPEASAAAPWEDYPGYLRERLRNVALSGQGMIVRGSFEERFEHFLELRGWRLRDERQLDDFWTDLQQQGVWWDPAPQTGAWERLVRTSSGRFEFCPTLLDERLRMRGAQSAGLPTTDPAALREGAAALGLEGDPRETCLPHHEPPREAGDGEVLLLPFRPLTGRGYGHLSRMVSEMSGYTVFSGWDIWAEMAPETAHELDLADGDEVALETDHGSIHTVIRVLAGTAPHTVHAPLGVLGRDEAGDARGPLELLETLHDPLSGAPCTAGTRARVRLLRRRPHGGPAPAEGGHG